MNDLHKVLHQIYARHFTQFPPSLPTRYVDWAYIRGNKQVEPEGQQPIADSVVTVAELLKQAGYATAAFGKWRLAPVGSEGDPRKQGFDQRPKNLLD